MSKLKKIVKPRAIELDPDEPTIIVNYDTVVVDQAQQGPDGEPVVVTKKSSKKRIKLKAFKAHSPIDKFAKEICDKCKYIHPSKLDFVAGLLSQLAARIRQQQEAAAGDKFIRIDDDEDDHDDNYNNIPSTTANSQNIAPVQRARPQSAARRRPLTNKTNNINNQSTHDHTNANTTSGIGNNDGSNSNAGGDQTTSNHITASSSTTSTSYDSASASDGNNSVKKDDATGSSADDNNNTNDGRYDLGGLYSANQHSSSLEPDTNTKAEGGASGTSTATDTTGNTDNMNNSFAQSATSTKVFGTASQIGGSMGDSMSDPQWKPPVFDDNSDTFGEQSKSSNTKKKKKKQKKKLRKEKEKPVEKADMKRIDDYLEMLYEEKAKEKIKGTAMLLQLVQDPHNLEYFIESDTILGALSRVLQEERRKSTELITNILEIFFCFSSFRQLHSILREHKIGDTTMRIIDLEIRRYNLKRKEYSTAEKMQDPKVAKFLQKQERLLFVCFYILLMLAEDPKVELIMKNRKIIKHLCKILERVNPDRVFLDELHTLVVTFLKKMSIFSENKDEMVEYQAVEKLGVFLASENEDLLDSVLRVLFNLSFYQTQRQSMTEGGMLTRFIHILQHVHHCHDTSLRLLYNISMDRSTRHDPGFTQCVPVVIKDVIRCRDKYVDKTLVSLAINLSTSLNNVEIMCSNDYLHHMIKRVHSTFDPLLMKLIRNISQHRPAQPLFQRYLHEIVGMAVQAQTMGANSTDFLIEVFGTLANIQLPGVLYSELLIKHNFLEFIMKHLVLGFSDDDIILQAIMVLSTLAIDPKAASIMGNNRLIRMLHDILNEKTQDVEIVLQLTYLVFKLLVHPHSREAIVSHDRLTYCILDLVMDPNADVRRIANLSLDIICEHDEDWMERIRDKRFEACNHHWLEFLNSGGIPANYHQNHDEINNDQMNNTEESRDDSYYDDMNMNEQMWNEHQMYDMSQLDRYGMDDVNDSGDY